HSSVYRHAVIVAEPGYLLESLPYYANNVIYFPRERRTGLTTAFTKTSLSRVSLGEVLAAAREVQARYHRPVLIALGHREVGSRDAGEKTFSYNMVFSWSANEVDELRRSTEVVADFEGSL